MQFIAYTFKGRKELRSAAHDTREQAAQELFQANAKLHRVETAVAVKTDEGTLVTFGKDIRSVSRLEAAKATAPKAPSLDTAEGTASAGRVERYRNYPFVLVIHVNAFTHKSEGGYMLRHGRVSERFTPAEAWALLRHGRVSERFTPAEAWALLAKEPFTPVEFLSV